MRHPLIQYTDSWVTGKRTNKLRRHKSEKREKHFMSLISWCVYSWLVFILIPILCFLVFQSFSLHFPHVSQCICFSIISLSLNLYFLHFSFLFGSDPPFLLICFLAIVPTLFTYLFSFVFSHCRTCNGQIGIMFYCVNKDTIWPHVSIMIFSCFDWIASYFWLIHMNDLHAQSDSAHRSLRYAYRHIILNDGF